MGCGCSSTKKLKKIEPVVPSILPKRQKSNSNQQREKVKPSFTPKKKIKQSPNSDSLLSESYLVEPKISISESSSNSKNKKGGGSYKKTKRKIASEMMNQSLGLDREKYILEKLAMMDESIEKLEKSIEKLRREKDRLNQQQNMSKIDLNSVKVNDPKNSVKPDDDDDISYSRGVLTIKRRLGSIAGEDSSKSKSEKSQLQKEIKRVHSLIKRRRSDTEKLKKRTAISQRLFMLKESKEEIDKSEVENIPEPKEKKLKSESKIPEKGKNRKRRMKKSTSDSRVESASRKKIRKRIIEGSNAEGVSEISLNYNLHEKMKKKNDLEKKLNISIFADRDSKRKSKKSQSCSVKSEKNKSFSSKGSKKKKKPLKIIYRRKSSKSIPKGNKIRVVQGFDKQVVIKRPKKRKNTEKKFKGSLSNFKAKPGVFNPMINKRMSIGEIISKKPRNKKSEAKNFYIKEKFKIEELDKEKKKIQEMIASKSGTVKLQRKSLIGIKKPIMLDKSMSQMSSILEDRSHFNIRHIQEPLGLNSQNFDMKMGDKEIKKAGTLELPHSGELETRKKQRGSTFKMNKKTQEMMANELKSMLMQVKEDKNECKTEEKEGKSKSKSGASHSKSINSEKRKKFSLKVKRGRIGTNIRRNSKVVDNIISKRHNFLKVEKSGERSRSNSIAEFKQFKIVKSSNIGKKFSAKAYVEKKKKADQEKEKLKNESRIQDKRLNISIGGLVVSGTPLSRYSSKGENFEDIFKQREQLNLEKVQGGFNNEDDKEAPIESVEDFRKNVEKNSAKNSIGYKRENLEISIDIDNYNPINDSIAIKSQEKFSKEDLNENDQENEELLQFVDEISKSERNTKTPKRNSAKKSMRDSIFNISVTKKGVEKEQDNSSEKCMTYDLPPRSGKRHDRTDKSIEKRLSRFSNIRNSINYGNENSLNISRPDSKSRSRSRDYSSYSMRNSSGKSRRKSRLSSYSGSKSKSRYSGVSASFTRTFIAEETIDEEGNDIVNQYKLMKCIGKGSFGKVRKAKNLRDKKLYVRFQGLIYF